MTLIISNDCKTSCCLCIWVLHGVAATHNPFTCKKFLESHLTLAFPEVHYVGDVGLYMLIVSLCICGRTIN